MDLRRKQNSDVDVAGGVGTLRRLAATLKGLRSLHMLLPSDSGLVFTVSGQPIAFSACTKRGAYRCSVGLRGQESQWAQSTQRPSFPGRLLYPF